MKILNIKLLFTLLLLATFINCQAQEAETLWTGTATIDLSTGTKPLANQRTRHVVYRSPETKQYDLTSIEHNSIGCLMLLAFQESRLIGYKDQELQEQFSTEAFTKLATGVDTIMIVHPQSYETTLKLVARSVNPADFENLRIHLRITFQSDGALQQEVIAVAINGTEYIDGSPTIYFSPNTIKSALNLSDSGWNAVMRTSIEIPFNELQPASDNQLSLSETFSQLNSLILETSAKDFSNTLDWGRLTKDETKSLSGGTDTVPIVNPETYAVEYALVPRKSLSEKADALRLYHFWAWNNTTSNLTFSPIGYAPLGTEKDENDKIIYRFPFINWAAPWYRK